MSRTTLTCPHKIRDPDIVLSSIETYGRKETKTLNWIQCFPPYLRGPAQRGVKLSAQALPEPIPTACLVLATKRTNGRSPDMC